MASRKDIEFSLNGEPQSQNQSDIISSEIALSERIEGSGEFVLFKLVDTNRRGSVFIDGISDLWNPETKKIERARLIAGLDSIWMKDQKDVDKNYISQNRRSLEFIGKVCRIYKYDHTALLFAQLHPSNIGSPHKKTGARLEFYEYNPKKQEEERLKRQMNKINLVLKVRDLEEAKMERLASFLGISFVDELGQKKSKDGIQAELLLRADTQPEVVAKYMDSKEVDIQFMVKKALVDSRIDVGSQPGNALWAGGGLIAKIPSGRKPLEYLTELAMTNNNEGRKLLEELQKMN